MRRLLWVAAQSALSKLTSYSSMAKAFVLTAVADERRLRLAGTYLVLSVLIMAYQNCAPNSTTFSGGPEQGKLSESPRFASDSLGIVGFQIEDGRPITQNAVLALHLRADNATHVSLFKNAGCNGAEEDWRTFQPLLPWELKSEEDRNRRWTLYARFKRGGDLSPCLKAEILHDDLSPQVTWRLVPREVTSALEAQIAFDVVDPKPREVAEVSGVSQVRCRFEEHRPANMISTPALKECTSGSLISLSTEGRITLIAHAIDQAGNESSEARSSFIVDRTAPRVRDLRIVTAALSTGRYHPSRVTFAWSGEDLYPDADRTRELSGVARYECRIQSEAWSACDPTATSLANLSVGEYRFQVRAIDQAGNSSTASSLSFAVEEPQSGPFSILGVLSSDRRDTMLDNVLARHASPSIVFSRSEGAASYEVSIWSSTEQQVCSPRVVGPNPTSGNTSLTANFSSECNLPDNGNFVARVVAMTSSGVKREERLSFRADRSAPQYEFLGWETSVVSTSSGRGVLRLRISDPAGVKSAKCFLKHHLSDQTVLQPFTCRTDGGVHSYTLDLKRRTHYWILIQSSEDNVGNTRDNHYQDVGTAP